MVPASSLTLLPHPHRLNYIPPSSLRNACRFPPSSLMHPRLSPPSTLPYSCFILSTSYHSYPFQLSHIPALLSIIPPSTLTHPSLILLPSTPCHSFLTPTPSDPIHHSSPQLSLHPFLIRSSSHPILSSSHQLSHHPSLIPASSHYIPQTSPKFCLQPHLMLTPLRHLSFMNLIHPSLFPSTLAKYHSYPCFFHLTLPVSKKFCPLSTPDILYSSIFPDPTSYSSSFSLSFLYPHLIPSLHFPCLIPSTSPFTLPRPIPSHPYLQSFVAYPLPMNHPLIHLSSFNLPRPSQLSLPLPICFSLAHIFSLNLPNPF